MVFLHLKSLLLYGLCIAIGPELLTHIYVAAPAESDQKINWSVQVLPLTIRIFNSKQKCNKSVILIQHHWQITLNPRHMAL